MTLRNLILYSLLTFFLQSAAMGQSDSIKLVGPIIELSKSGILIDSLDVSTKKKVDEYLSLYQRNRETLNRYFYLTDCKRDFASADKLKRSDKILKRINKPELSFIFELGRESDLGMLGKPRFSTVVEKDPTRLIYIVCTPEQYIELKNSAKELGDQSIPKFEFTCQYFGDYILLGAKIYQLISFRAE